MNIIISLTITIFCVSFKLNWTKHIVNVTDKWEKLQDYCPDRKFNQRMNCNNKKERNFKKNIIKKKAASALFSCELYETFKISLCFFKEEDNVSINQIDFETTILLKNKFNQKI